MLRCVFPIVVGLAGQTFKREISSKIHPQIYQGPPGGPRRPLRPISPKTPSTQDPLKVPMNLEGPQICHFSFYLFAVGPKTQSANESGLPGPAVGPKSAKNPGPDLSFYPP